MSFYSTSESSELASKAVQDADKAVGAGRLFTPKACLGKQKKIMAVGAAGLLALGGAGLYTATRGPETSITEAPGAVRGQRYLCDTPDTEFVCFSTCPPTVATPYPHNLKVLSKQEHDAWDSVPHPFLESCGKMEADKWGLIPTYPEVFQAAAARGWNATEFLRVVDKSTLKKKDLEHLEALALFFEDPAQEERYLCDNIPKELNTKEPFVYFSTCKRSSTVPCNLKVLSKQDYDALSEAGVCSADGLVTRGKMEADDWGMIPMYPEVFQAAAARGWTATKFLYLVNNLAKKDLEHLKTLALLEEFNGVCKHGDSRAKCKHCETIPGLTKKIRESGF